MSLAIEKILAPATGHPAQCDRGGGGSEAKHRRRLHVLESALAALKEAGSLASGLGARITLLVPQMVPYPLPLESPPVLLDFSENRFRVIASESPVETSVQIYLVPRSLRNTDLRR